MDHSKKELPVVTFGVANDWREWLASNHSGTTGLWLRFFKKDSGKQTFSYSQALDEALCYGWIDGQAKRFDEHILQLKCYFMNDILVSILVDLDVALEDFLSLFRCDAHLLFQSLLIWMLLWKQGQKRYRGCRSSVSILVDLDVALEVRL